MRWDIHHCYINEMFIKSTCQQQGIGTFMLNEIKKMLKMKNIVSIIVLTTKNIPAEQLYLRNDFFHNECMVQLYMIFKTDFSYKIFYKLFFL